MIAGAMIAGKSLRSLRVGIVLAGTTIAGEVVIAGGVMVINLLQHQLVGKMTVTCAMR